MKNKYLSLVFLSLTLFLLNMSEVKAQKVHTFLDTIQSGDPTLTGSRLNRFQPPSTCASPKTCPGLFGTNGQYYDTFQFRNVSSSTQCVTVTYGWISGIRVFFAAYTNYFDPGNACTNYLADGASTVSGTSPATDTVVFSFNLAAGATLVLVGNGANASEACEYNLSVVGNSIVLFNSLYPKTACEGSNTFFTIDTTGSDSTYWQVNEGSGWSSGTRGGDTLFLNNVTTAMDSNQYRALYYNGTTIDTISGALLTVISPANITTEPTDTALCKTGDATFGLLATGTITGYQWQRNTGSGWSDLSGTNNDTLELTGLTSTQDGYLYRCVVSAACGNDTSRAALLDVANPLITATQGDTVCVGTTANLSATTSEGSVRWYENTSGGAPLYTGGNINVPNVLVDDTLYAEAFIPPNPDSLNATESWTLATYANNISGTMFDIKALKNGNLDSMDIQLYQNTDRHDIYYIKGGYSGGLNDINNWTLIDSFVSFNSNDGLNDQLSRFKFTTSLSLEKDSIYGIFIHTYNKVSGTFQFSTTSVTTGNMHAANEDLIKYAGIFRNISFNTTTHNNFSILGNLYYSIPTLHCNSVSRTPVIIKSLPLANITQEASNDTLCAGNNALFGILATGTIIGYQWQVNSGSGWSNLGGHTNDTLSLINVTNVMNGYSYQCIVISDCGNDTSAVVTLKVNPNPDITNISSSLNPSYNSIYQPLKCSNLNATTTGGTGSYTYSWTPAGSGNPLNVCPTIGTWYKATVTDSFGCQDTMSFKQSVIDATSTFPGRVTMCVKNNRTNRYSTLPVLLSSVPYYLNLPGAGNTLGACGAIPSKQGDAGFEDFADYYKVYPNPFTSELNIEMVSLFEEEVNIELTDMTGRVVKTIFNGNMYEGDLARFTLDASDLPNGLYFVRYTSNTDIRVNKVQLMR